MSKKFVVTCQPPSSMRLRYVCTDFNGRSVGLTMVKNYAKLFSNVTALKLAQKLREKWPLDVWTAIEADE